MREIHFYRTSSGRCPVDQFLDSLGPRQVRKIYWVLRLVEEMETPPVQYFKKMVGADDLWEVRARHGGDTFRLLGFLHGPELLVLTSGFAKKTQKTPRTEIDLAIRRRREYLSRGAHDE